MKVLSVRPGKVWATTYDTWVYTVNITHTQGKSNPIVSRLDYPSANAAKQAMREEVRHLRVKHCCVKEST